jgi:outer membrane protein OmpU
MARMGVVSSETAATAAVAPRAATAAELTAVDEAFEDFEADPTSDNLNALLAAGAAVAAAEAGTDAVKKKRTNTVDNRVQFDLRGKSVIGELTFGGHIRMRGTNGATTLNGGQVSVSGAGLTVFGGNIPGPLDSMANVYGYTVGYSGGTFQGLVNQVDSMAYSSTGSGANAIQANYSISDLTVKAAYQPSTENSQIAVEYSFSGLTVAVGAQMASGKADDMTVGTVAYSFGDVSAAVGYSDNNGNSKATLSATATVADGITLTGYYSDLEGAAEEGYGVGFSYDLGAGARLAGAYENAFDGGNRAEFGVTFSF